MPVDLWNFWGNWIGFLFSPVSGIIFHTLKNVVRRIRVKKMFPVKDFLKICIYLRQWKSSFEIPTFTIEYLIHILRIGSFEGNAGCWIPESDMAGGS